MNAAAAEERTSDLVEKEIMEVVDIQGDLTTTTENILEAPSKYTVTQVVEVIPSNPVENFPLNGNPLQIG